MTELREEKIVPFHAEELLLGGRAKLFSRLEPGAVVSKFKAASWTRRGRGVYGRGWSHTQNTFAFLFQSACDF